MRNEEQIKQKMAEIEAYIDLMDERKDYENIHIATGHLELLQWVLDGTDLRYDIYTKEEDQ
jgi:hypothetical protein